MPLATLSRLTRFIDIKRKADILAFMANHSFCTLISYNSKSVYVSHINVILQQENTFFGHLAASNAQARALRNDSMAALAIFKDRTHESNPLNVVHMLGIIKIIASPELLQDGITKLVKKYESTRSAPWNIDWSDEKISSQLRGVVGFQLIPTMIREALTLSPSAASAAAELVNMSMPFDMGNIAIDNVASIYIPPYFDESSPASLLELVERSPACTMIVFNSKPDAKQLLIYHVEHTSTKMTSERLNITGRFSVESDAIPACRERSLKAMLIFNGPHTYISPSFYETPHSVPTWNYVVAHVQGIVNFEHHDPSELQFTFDVASIKVKSKFNQNRTLEDRLGVVAGLTASACPMARSVGAVMEQRLCPKL